MIKRVFVLLLIILFSIQFCFSQEKTPKFHYSVKAGINTSFMSVGDLNKDIFSTDVMIGFNGGFKTIFDINKRLSIAGEILVSTQNYSVKFVAGHSTAGEKWLGDIRYYTTNLSIPLMLMINVTPIFGIELGAQYSYKMFVRDLLDCPYAHILITYPHDNYREFSPKVFNRSDVAALVGLSVRINKFAINLRYINGFIPAIEKIKFNTSPPDNAQNIIEDIDRDFKPILRTIHLCFEYTF